jgi:uncharacterized protein (TIGR03086 family)
METIELLDQAYGWTADRIATVSADALDAPTPCGQWTLQELLDHTIDTLRMLTDPVATSPADGGLDVQDVPVVGSTPWAHSIAEVAAQSRLAWKAPGVMDRTFELPMGAMTAPILASATLLEGVMHGWDISQASGEAAEIPENLAIPVLEFARQALSEADRGDHFATDLGIGETPSDQLVAFLGRKPL